MELSDTTTFGRILDGASVPHETEEPACAGDSRRAAPLKHLRYHHRAAEREDEGEEEEGV